MFGRRRKLSTRIQPFDIGCQPSPSVPAETLLQDGWATYLLFFAVSSEVDATGFLTDLRVAVLSAKNCVVTKFGYPNDEGLEEHPLFQFGMADCESSVLEAVESPWLEEMIRLKDASAKRIWTPRGKRLQSVRESGLHHFILPLKEATFECIAASIEVERFCDTFDEATSYVFKKFSEH